MHGAMRALGVAGTPAPAGRLPLERAPAGTRVIILGAGVAGLATAHELRKLGYEYEILEARARVGGRCFTVRRGQASEEVGTAPQKAAFDPDLYLNAGAARIPHHHAPTLDLVQLDEGQDSVHVARKDILRPDLSRGLTP